MRHRGLPPPDPRATWPVRFRFVEATDLAFAGIARQLELLDAGEVGSRELTQLYLDRIERIDPQLNAYRRVLGESALAEADAADAARAKGGAGRCSASRSRTRTTSRSPARWR